MFCLRILRRIFQKFNRSVDNAMPKFKHTAIIHVWEWMGRHSTPVSFSSPISVFVIYNIEKQVGEPEYVSFIFIIEWIDGWIKL